MRFAYADPPYPKKAFYYAERAEVDHAGLIAHLVGGFPDGWALSTSAEALREVLALCPADVRVCAWFKKPRPTPSRRPVTGWEPLIVWRGRPYPVAAPQVLSDALIELGRWRSYPGALIGMKPPTFAAWMFQQLGAAAGDELVDLFPGSGAIGRAWIRFTSQPGASDASPVDREETSPLDQASSPAAAVRDPSCLTAVARDEIVVKFEYATTPDGRLTPQVIFPTATVRRDVGVPIVAGDA